VNKEFVAAINQVCHDRQLPKEVVLEAVEAALVSAYRRKFGATQGIIARIDPDTGEARIFTDKEVVETVADSEREVSLDEARKIEAEAQIGELVPVETTPKNFGRIAAQTARQVILQRIREAERDSLFSVYADREGEIINGTVQSIEPHQVTLSLGKVEAILPRSEQMPTERYSIGQRLRAYVAEVQRTPRGPIIIVSRTHRNMLRRLLELEVPEIFNGTVQIHAIAREAGFRSKVAVNATQEGVDPVGSCVGMRGVRIQSIVNELNGEKIDVVAWSPDAATLIANGLSPAKVLNVMLDEESGDRTATVVVPDKQLSLAIGKEGQNARLAAKLTNWRIDIKSITEAAAEALHKVTAQEEIKEAIAQDQDILAIAKEILSEKEGPTLSDGEAQALSRAVEIVRNAEAALNKVRAAARLREAIAQALEQDKPSGPRPRVETDADLLSRAEAILATNQSTLDETQEEEIRAIEAALADMEEVTTAEEEELQPEAPVAEAADVTEELEVAVDAEAEEALTTETAKTAEEIEAVTLEEETTAEAQPSAEADTEEVMVTAESVEEVEGAAKEPEQETIPSEEAPGESDTAVKWVADSEFDEDDLEDKSSKKKRQSRQRELVFDEDLGEVVAKRRRKPGRQRESWEDYY
jgi:transcription termination/antitermination protein NusA